MRKKLLIVSILCLLAASFFNVYASDIYEDVKETDWFYDAVINSKNMRIMNGYDDGTFKPENYVTAEEFIKIIVCAGQVEPASFDGYSNMDCSPWADKYLLKLKDLGVIDANCKLEFRKPITREQVTNIIVKFLKIEEYRPSYTYDEYIKRYIKDFDKIDKEYEKDVLAAYAFGIMQGDTDDNFNPKSYIKRSEAAIIGHRIRDKQARLTLDRIKKDYPGCVMTLPIKEGVYADVAIPIYKGKPLYEIDKVVKAFISKMDETKGVDSFEYIDFSGNIIGDGFENIEKWNYVFSLDPTKPRTTEELTKLAKASDYSIFVNMNSLEGKFDPYEMVFYKDIPDIEDEKYSMQFGKWGEFFDEYYAATVKAVFKVLFEDDFEAAWNTLREGIYYSNYRDMNYINKYLMFNKRYFTIHYNWGNVSLRVSLKQE